MTDQLETLRKQADAGMPARYTNPTKHDIEFAPFVQAFTDNRLSGTEEKPEGAAAFVIDSESAANWYLKKITLMQAEKDILKAQYEQRVKEIDTDKARLETMYQSQLEAWARREQETRRRKTITLGYGTVSFRTVPAHVKVSDIDAAIEHAQTLGEGFVFSVVKLDTAAYAKHCEKAMQEGENPNGVTLPGCEWIPTRESVSIKTATKKSEGWYLRQGDTQDAETIAQDIERA
jgi:hypothetical protein